MTVRRNNLLKDLDIKQVSLMFDTEEKCLEYLADAKWNSGFTCRYCGNTNYCKGRKAHSRRCTKCKHEESATSHTIFHGCRMPITEAFQMAVTVCHKPDISTYKMAEQFDTRQMTCWKFKKKILECIESKGELKMLLDELEMNSRQ